MRIITLLWMIVCLMGLASCATMQPASQLPQNQNVTWDSRATSLAKIQSWNLRGMIAIRTPKDSGSATLQWQQQQQNYYHISLFGPLGSHSVEITGRPGNVTLASADGKTFHANSPEELLAQQLGWRLPISNLYYWVRGIPVPGAASQKSFDSYHHLTQLTQNGWSIRYLSYTAVNGVDLPSKIFMDNPQLNVKIIINQWQI